ncbi:hypothetical protein ACFLQJ_03020 [Calditrichota bacterium]
MSKFVGLTNDPENRKKLHGEPDDWELKGPFETEREARNWEMLKRATGFNGAPRGDEWKYGYTYTTSNKTIENI